MQGNEWLSHAECCCFICHACRFDEVKAKVYERLLRKLLTKPNRPAVVLLQLMPKGMAYEASRCVHGALSAIQQAGPRGAQARETACSCRLT